MALRPIVKFPDNFLRQATAAVDGGRRRGASSSSPTWSRPCTPRTARAWPPSRSAPTARIFIVEASVAGGDENDHPVVFINPTIEWLSDETETGDEGCLSFPGIYVPIKRSLRARVRATGLDGKSSSPRARGSTRAPCSTRTIT